MKSDKLLYKALSVFAAVTILFCSLLTAANAITTKNGSITIHVADAKKNTPISDASFRLYFFAKESFPDFIAMQSSPTLIFVPTINTSSQDSGSIPSVVGEFAGFSSVIFMYFTFLESNGC